jgi:hypothetical protein
MREQFHRNETACIGRETACLQYLCFDLLAFWCSMALLLPFSLLVFHGAAAFWLLI